MLQTNAHIQFLSSMIQKSSSSQSNGHNIAKSTVKEMPISAISPRERNVLPL